MRAKRRHHYQRMKAKRIRQHLERNTWEADRRERAEFLAPSRANTAKLCSSPWCCGNQRKMCGPTLQELKATFN